MWRPGFPFVERRRAVLHGRRRAFCIYSVHHRGTYERPGLVLGLAPGGSVRGAAYRVAAAQWEEVYGYLREREQPTETYFEAWSDLKIDGEAAKISSLVFLSDMKHSQWAGALSLEQQADLIAGAKGLSGRNIDYLSDLVGHLREDGVRDHAMETLLKLVAAREDGSTNPSL